VVFDEASFPFSKASSPPTRAALDFLDDVPNTVSVPFELSLVFSSTSTAATKDRSPGEPHVAVPDYSPQSLGQPCALQQASSPSPAALASPAADPAAPTPHAARPAALALTDATGPRVVQPAPPAATPVAPRAITVNRFGGQVYSRRRPPTAVSPSPAAQASDVARPPDDPGTTPIVPVGAVVVPPMVNHHRMTTRGKRGLRFPALFEASALSPIPRSYRVALADPHWRAAMEQEYAALVGNNTWDLVPRPPHYNVVTGKWIFKHKFNADGSLERYKARWVLRGFTQRPGIDFSETFSPVVKPATVRTVLSLALSRGWPIHQLDVNNAFLHGTLSETVICTQPTGFEDSTHPDYVCRLNRSLYGLKQAPRAWYSRFASHLLQLSFIEAKTDMSLFVYHKGADMAYLLMYVDDIVLTASSLPTLRRIISALQQEFPMKDLGRLHHFLGMHVQHSTSGIYLSQHQYLIEILERAGMSDCKPCTTPVDVNPKLPSDGAPVSDPTDYRSLAEALQYLTFTRPDIVYVVQ
jgi:hypothetical protein